MKKEIIKTLDRLIKEIQDRENDCYRQMAFCNEHKFEMEREAIHYAQQAYNCCKLEAFDARDKIVELLKEEE